MKAIAKLDAELLLEVATGVADLPLPDRYHFDLPLGALLDKNLPYKKSWLANVHSARQRQIRRAAHDLTAGHVDAQRQLMLNWMRLGRLQPGPPPR